MSESSHVVELPEGARSPIGCGKQVTAEEVADYDCNVVQRNGMVNLPVGWRVEFTKMGAVGYGPDGEKFLFL